MFTEINNLEQMTPQQLDAYLNRGWFRMGQMIFTCRFLNFGNDLYTAVWIRLDLKEYKFRKSLRKILKKNGERFRIVVRRAVFNMEKEMLYHEHKSRFEGYVAGTLKESLHVESGNIYDTWEICVYDGYRLVAVSFFDNGSDSLASIMGLFDPAYTKYSLGFYTMLLEISIGLENNKKYYYPGYVVPGYQRFDYKLRVGETDYYLPETNEWRPYSEMIFEELPSEILNRKLKEIQTVLTDAGIDNRKILYPLYDKEMYGYEKLDFVKYPYFISCYHQKEKISLLIIEYDLHEEKYRISQVNKFEDTLSYLAYLLFEGHDEENSYLEFLCREKVLLESTNMDDIVEKVKTHADWTIKRNV